MMERRIRLTEGDLHRIVKESVNKILSELDWRTYQSAADKAKEKSDNASNGYEQKRRAKQHNKFQDAAIERYDKQYGIDDIKKKRREAENRGEKYEETNGELKRLGRGSDDAEKFYSGKSKYGNGKWG